MSVYYVRSVETARAIDAATGSAVPFELWQSEFLTRSGLAA